MAAIPAQSDAVHHALDQAERGVAATGQALLQGDPEQVHLATRALHDSAHALALVLRTFDNSAGAVRDRLMRVARDVAMQREALLRRSAAVDRCVQSLLPQVQQKTYADELGRYAARSLRRPAFGSF